MTERYECHLSPELLEKAVTELHEPRDNAERLLAIDTLRESYDSEKYGPLVRSDDGFILRFLRAKKFNQQKALKCLHNHHAVKKEFQEVFEKVHNPTVLQPIVDRGILSVLDGKTVEGASIFMYRPGLLDKDVNLYDLMAYGVLALEKILEKEENQICGIVSVEDLENFSVSIMFQVSPFQLSRLNSIYQDAMPIRFRAVYLLNEGRVIDAVMALMKPFMKKKLLDRIHPIGNKYSKLYEHIPQSVLPPHYGGTGPDHDTFVESWIARLTEDWPQDTAL